MRERPEKHLSVVSSGFAAHTLRCPNNLSDLEEQAKKGLTKMRTNLYMNARVERLRQAVVDRENALSAVSQLHSRINRREISEPLKKAYLIAIPSRHFRLQSLNHKFIENDDVFDRESNFVRDKKVAEKTEAEESKISEILKKLVAKTSLVINPAPMPPMKRPPISPPSTPPAHQAQPRPSSISKIQIVEQKEIASERGLAFKSYPIGRIQALTETSGQGMCIKMAYFISHLKGKQQL
eukprot:TRINITY_DN2148_c0_g1_i8.p1 TRINITY_DN2148_c0_g1~~TRINITY_DN2148_c0_g1_i8.p1  ORF type:complete len:238 (+),score=34.40 TRINITY_DN2148_c0_g1_i8:131-844(+)